MAIAIPLLILLYNSATQLADLQLKIEKVSVIIRSGRTCCSSSNKVIERP
jgi:hypothetical protein